VTGIFAQGFVSGRRVVDGDAAATATNILTHKSLFELGFSVYLIEMACQIAVTAALILWPLVFGVNEQRWKEEARAAVE
jgi:hypothetical protein